MKDLTHEPITLSTFHLYPMQQVFDKVAKHLLTQNARSVRKTPDEDYCDAGEDQCAYRGDDGKMCAVGCLISDEEYTPYFEGMFVFYVVMNLHQWSHDSDIPYDVRARIALLTRLQFIHDSIAPALWSSCLAACANKFGLTFTP